MGYVEREIRLLKNDFHPAGSQSFKILVLPALLWAGSFSEYVMPFAQHDDVIARRAAPWQSRFVRRFVNLHPASSRNGRMDCFASLAMTGSHRCGTAFTHGNPGRTKIFNRTAVMSDNKQPKVAKKNEVPIVRSSAAEYLAFVAAAGRGGVEAVYADENVWLTQKMMGQLYDVETHAINYHLKKVFSDSELDEGSVVRNFR